MGAKSKQYLIRFSPILFVSELSCYRCLTSASQMRLMMTPPSLLGPTPVQAGELADMSSSQFLDNFYSRYNFR